jgi:hypothetical protein
MFVVSSQVRVRDHSLRTALRIGVPRAVGDGLLSVPIEMHAEGMSLASEDMGKAAPARPPWSLSLYDSC